MQKQPRPRGSLFDAKERRIVKEIQKKSELIQSKILSIPSLPAETLENAQTSISRFFHTFENSIISNEIWIFVSIPSFQVSIEERDNPDLRAEAFAISNGCEIQSFNSIAANFSIKCTMPEFQALSLCKSLLLIRENQMKYKAESLKVREVLQGFDPQFEENGLDQAALCVTSLLKRRCMDTDAGREALAQEIRRKIFLDTQLEAKAGIACNKFLAQVACFALEGAGQYYLRPENVKKFMKDLRVADNPGFGKNDVRLLEMIGVLSCGDVVKKQLELFLGISEICFKKYLKIALGVGEFVHLQSRKDTKTYSVSKNFDPIDQEEFLEFKLKELCETLDYELKRNKLKGKGIEIILKNEKYESKVRREESKHYYSDGKELYDLAVILLRMFYPVKPIRSLILKAWKLKQTNEDQNPNKYIPYTLKVKDDNEFQKMFLYHSIVPNNSVPEDSVNKKPSKKNSMQCTMCEQVFNGREYDFKMHVKHCQGKKNYFNSLRD